MGKPGNIYSHTGLRGLAALYVVLFHFVTTDLNGFEGKGMFFQLFQWGNYAVDLFFILSGFILNWVYLSEPGAFKWGPYIRARVGRIMPLYYLTLCLLMIVSVFSTPTHSIDPIGKNWVIDIGLNLFMMSGIVYGWIRTINGPAWSIGVEFFCYLTIFPVLFRLNRYFTGKSYSLPVSIGLVAVTTIGVAASYHTEHIHIHNWIWDGSSLSRGIFGFSCGFILCSIFRNLGSWRPGHLTSNMVSIVAGTIVILASLHVISKYWVPCVIPAIVFFTAFDTGLTAAVLKTGPIQWLGERSYSIYLWHAIFLSHTDYLKNHFNEPANFAIVMSMILVTSELSYRFFECPAREFIRNRFSGSAAGQQPALGLSRRLPST